MVAGATSESNIAVLLNGYIPVLLKADFLETWPSCMHGLDVSFATLFFVILMPGFFFFLQIHLAFLIIHRFEGPTYSYI